jgi:hypothetical protein
VSSPKIIFLFYFYNMAAPRATLYNGAAKHKRGINLAADAGRQAHHHEDVYTILM